MKYFWIIAVFFLIQTAQAQIITVGEVKVSVKAESPASAREQALDQAHQLAFQKLMTENFPEKAFSLPSQDILRDMVNDFSIDREKTTPTSYTASMTFQFDELQVTKWIQQFQQDQSEISPLYSQDSERIQPLKIRAFYETHLDWQHIKKALEKGAHIQDFVVFALSPKSADLEIMYSGSIDQLKKELLQKDIFLSQKDEGWVISLKEQAVHSDIVIN